MLGISSAGCPLRPGARRVVVRLQDQREIEQQGGHDGGDHHRRIGHVEILGHDERDRAHHRRHQRPAGRGAGFDGAGVGRRVSDTLHRRDRQLAGGHDVRDDAARERTEQAARDDRDLGRSAARAPEQGRCERHEEFAAAGHHQRRAEDEKADQQAGDDAHRHADDAFGAKRMLAHKLLDTAGWSPQEAGHLFGEQRIEKEEAADHEQHEATDTAYGLEREQAEDAGDDGRQHRCANVPAFLDDVFAMPCEITGCDRGDDREEPVVPRQVALGAGMGRIDHVDQREKDAGQQVEVGGVDQQRVDEELQVPELVDVQQDADGAGSDRDPARETRKAPALRGRVEFCGTGSIDGLVHGRSVLQLGREKCSNEMNRQNVRIVSDWHHVSLGASPGIDTRRNASLWRRTYFRFFAR